MLYSDNTHVFPVEEDVVFVGLDTDAFLIRATDDNRFYVRPSLNDPVGSSDITKNLQSDSNHITPVCLYGGYFDSFEEALKTSIEWLAVEPKDLPKCENPPRFKSDET